MTNPYKSLPSYAFWRRSVTEVEGLDVDPVVDVPFKISKHDRVATAGSCFAQHISRTLVADGFEYLVTEAEGENSGVFPARFGNIYSAKQLRQLFERAYGLLDPIDAAWVRPDGRWVDPFRPQILTSGFADQDALAAEREIHLESVRSMFERCDVFLFTLGLTEAWVSKQDGAVVPLAPGVVGGGDKRGDYEFRNFDVADITADLTTLIDWLRRINSHVRVMLTVSPVPLVATFEKRHVLVSTNYSKSALCVAAHVVSQSRPAVAYFPSYEIITGPQARGRFYEDDLREIRPEGVAHVMKIFRRHFLTEKLAGEQLIPSGRSVLARGPTRDLEDVICEEKMLDAGD